MQPVVAELVQHAATIKDRGRLKPFSSLFTCVAIPQATNMLVWPLLGKSDGGHTPVLTDDPVSQLFFVCRATQSACVHCELYMPTLYSRTSHVTWPQVT
jgi:hypothetical protein